MTRRVALVTGGGRGIGRAICLALAADERTVAAADIRTGEADETAALVGEAGGEAIAVTMDVTDSSSVQAGVDAVASKLGPVEVLVNNAGWDAFMPFVDTDEDFWDRVIEINYKGHLRTVQACLPPMLEAGWGRVVAISSDAGRVGSSLEAVYSGAKGAVIAFTKTLAREVARAGVTANSVCPGPTDTTLLAELASQTDDASRVIDGLRRAVPMKRLGEPHEVAAAVAFLAGESAGYITGQTLSVSGGLTMA